MTTTDRTGPRAPGPRLPLTPLEWKLVVATVLAVAYSTTFLGVAATVDSGAAADPTALRAREPAAGSTPSATATWIGDLPPAARPEVTVPPGWTVVTAPTSGSAQPGKTARADVPSRRSAPRIRTRSS